jgi:hypothetical protein
MPQLLVTLIGEGPSDDALIPIIEWVLERPALGLLPDVDVISRFVGPDKSDSPSGLVGRITDCANEAPGHLFFIHHDADGPTHHEWAESIRQAVVDVRQQGTALPPAPPVVPVREMEAWLLIDETAIRRAARNPGGRAPLGLPHVRAIESCQDPKAILREALRAASGLPRRRWSEVDAIAPRIVADFITDFTPLQQLVAFQAFSKEVEDVIRDQHWPERFG